MNLDIHSCNQFVHEMRHCYDIQPSVDNTHVVKAVSNLFERIFNINDVNGDGF